MNDRLEYRRSLGLPKTDEPAPDIFDKANIRAHIGWLKIYTAMLSAENWRNMQDRLRSQLTELAGIVGIDPPDPPAQYEAPRNESIPLRVRGVGRMGDEPRALLLCLNENPTDDELRALHEHLRWWYEH